MSRTLFGKTVAMTAAVAGMAVAVTASLSTGAVAAPSTATERAQSAVPVVEWFVDPRTPAQRKAQIAVPAKPAKYRGKLRETRAVYRTQDGALAVPIRTATGHQLEKGQAVTLDGDGLFTRNSAKLTPAAKRQLATFNGSLTDAASIRCEGYTDFTGSKVRNRTLSKRRAAAVCGQLVSLRRGLSQSSVGFGSTRPAVVGGKVAQRKLNRRVVIELTRAKPAAPQATTPGAPTLVGLYGEQGGVGYSFRAPISDGGAPITGYQVNSGNGWSAVQSMPARAVAERCAGDCGDDLIRGRIWDLTPGSEITIRVRAVNRVGGGAPSESLSTTVLDVPGAPGNLVAAAQDRTVTLTFEAPSDGGAWIMGYEVKTDDGEWVTATVAQGSVVLADQTPGTHTYQLRARNWLGTGAAATSNQVVIAQPGPTVYRAEHYYSMGTFWSYVFLMAADGAQSYEARFDNGDWLPITIEGGQVDSVYGHVVDPVCSAGGCTAHRTVEVRAIFADGPGDPGNTFTSSFLTLG
ncbi:OmpA family protein [Nocardioides sp. Bht2]|uniref:OmpA family protein n=1 Tax=Nocardioides sp. Bht2 TaxID=3392297 RepID=UPI0039B6276A